MAAVHRKIKVPGNPFETFKRDNRRRVLLRASIKSSLIRLKQADRADGAAAGMRRIPRTGENSAAGLRPLALTLTYSLGQFSTRIPPSSRTNVR